MISLIRRHRFFMVAAIFLIASVPIFAQIVQAVPRVQVRTMALAQARQTIEFAGRLEPRATLSHPAPFAGQVERILVKTGQWVQAGQALFVLRRSDMANRDFAPATVVSRISGLVADIAITAFQDININAETIRVADIAVYRMQTSVSDKDVPFLPEGTQAQLVLARGEKLTGTVTQRSLLPQGNSGLFAVVFEFPRANSLSLGQFVKVEVETEKRQTFLLPRSAVVRRLGSQHVWAIRDKTVVLTPVKTGGDYGLDVEIVEGLQAGDLVGVSWDQTLRNNLEVNLVPEGRGRASSGDGPPQQRP